MASNDTAALVVALSAQLTRFEKDMQGAVAIANKRTKEIETRFGAMGKEINSQLSSFAASQASNIGALGSSLLRLGPAGIAAAVGIGTAVGAVLALVNATDAFAAKARVLVEMSETTGLTITQLKLLGYAGQRVGLDFDESTAFFTQFITRMKELRGGGGPLFDALLKIDEGLLRQLSVTTDSAKAVDLLVAAYGRLTSASAKLELAKAAGGKGGLSGGRLLDEVGSRGSLSGLQAASPAIDEAKIEREARLKQEIDAIRARAYNLFGGMFSDTTLRQEKEVADQLLAISQWLKRILGTQKEINAIGPLGGGPAGSLGSAVGARGEIFQDLRERRPTSLGGRRNAIQTPGVDTSGGPLKLDGVDSPRAPNTPGSAAADLAILQKNIALLGDAVTQGEQYREKQLQIAAAVAAGGIKSGIATRAQAAFNLVQHAAVLATLERLGVANEQQIVEVRLAQLQADKIKFGLTENQVQTATVVILREAKQAAEALEVRRAYLPGLKQLELDAKNVRKSLDELGVNGVKAFEDGLVDIVSRTKSVSDAFRDMANSIIKDIARMLIRQSITGPLAGLIGGSVGAVGIPTFAGGGVMERDGLAMLHANEVIFTPEQIRALSRPMQSAGGAISVGGGNTSIVIQGNADEKTIGMMRQELARRDQEFQGRVLRVVGSARSRRAQGI